MAKDFRVRVHDPRVPAAAIRAAGALPATWQVAALQEVLILCVPIRQVEGVLRKIARRVRPGALVLDTASVKERPAALMAKLLPKSVNLVATHPAFGPDSAAASLAGHKIVLCPVRVERRRYACVKKYLRGLGLRLIETTPVEHDRQMAQTLVLTHFIGRGLIGFGAEDLPMDTEGYKRLRRILQTVQNDTWELFVDMNRYNRYARTVRRSFLGALRDVERRLGV